jgi:hypothetical protein
MEIECMEAEAREFRTELWRVVEGESMGVPRRPLKSVILGRLGVVALACLLVMSSGLPLSMDQDRPFQGFSDTSVALLTSAESDILNALRESLSSLNASRVLLSIEMEDAARDGLPSLEANGAALALEPPKLEPAALEPQVRVVRVFEKAEVENAASADERLKGDAPPAQAEAGHTAEEVISLIQVGQQALRISEPAVRIVAAP